MTENEIIPETGKEYLAVLKKSHDSVINSLNELKNENIEFDEINKIQKSLVFDSRDLIIFKNKFKNDIFKLQSDLSKKNIDANSQIKNSFLLKLMTQKFNNSLQLNSLNEYIEKIPDLKLLEILPDTNDDINNIDESINIDSIKSANISLDEIREMLLNKEKEDEIDINKYLILENVEDQINKFLDDSDLRKFKLIQLHDNYYQKKLSSLQDIDKKWTNELNKIKGFVNHDINKMKSDLITKLELENGQDSKNENVREEDFDLKLDEGDDVLMSDEDEEEDEEDEEEEIEDDIEEEEIEQYQEDTEMEVEESDQTKELVRENPQKNPQEGDNSISPAFDNDKENVMEDETPIPEDVDIEE